ncbi:solute carrier family 25 member 38 [Schizopora paradoxa]|uniref:Mitochondrial glycine transporter n=1 Tax=Schizopora paradoxa TaxID=27342 RepID=A0A0H2S0H6_9AGAM|nr:solute carrier family 25 member 38 [Schizopora paradoxa]
MSNVGQHLLSGGLSGLASTVLLQPFDLVKTRLQQGDRLSDNVQKPRVASVARDVLKKDGIIGLWRGTVPSLFRNVPGVALYMTSLTHIRAHMSSYTLFVANQPSSSNSGSTLPKLASHGNILAGAVTRVSVGFILNPFSVLKARYESNMFNNKYRSFPSALGSILRSGPSELFKGFVPSAIRDAPYAGIFVATYESIKRRSSKITSSSSAPSFLSSTAIHTFSAASAGAIATVVTHPFDVIKTKVQVRQEDRYHGFLRTIMTIWEQRGARGFFDGVSLRVSRKVFSSAIGWAVYEGMLIFMYDDHGKSVL